MVKRINPLMHCNLMKIMHKYIYKYKICECNHSQIVPQQAQAHDSCTLRDHEGVHTIVGVMLAANSRSFATTDTSRMLHVNEVAPQPFDGCGICLSSPCFC